MKKVFTAVITVIMIASLFTLSVFAEEGAVGLGSEATIFEQIYAAVLANSDAIFSALAFAASLLIAFTYKRGRHSPAQGRN